MRLQPIRVGLALGGVLGLYHLAWSLLVALGWGQALLDFILWMHFLKVPAVVGPFEAGRATILVAATFALGWAIGALFAATWNGLHRSARA